MHNLLLLTGVFQPLWIYLFKKKSNWNFKDVK